MLPSRTSITIAVQQLVVPSGLSGGALAVAHGHTIVHEQLAKYRPFSFQAIALPSLGAQRPRSEPSSMTHGTIVRKARAGQVEVKVSPS